MSQPFQPLSGSGELGEAASEQPTPAEVRAALEKIIESPLFQRSNRLHRFLRFTVEQVLAGRSREIAEYSLGHHVFDRGDTFDPSSDSIVRVEARRLRHKLSEYYKQMGASDPVLIAIYPGTYAPVFQYRALPKQPQPTAVLDSRTVAVLPFVNMSSDPGQDFFCDGMTEELLNSLATIPELQVVARTSSFFFKGKGIDVRQIGQQLGAGTIVEGSVRKAGEVLRITAQVVNATTGMHLWSNTFDRDFPDVFAVQDEIATAVAEALETSLFRIEDAPVARETVELEAYIYYLKGQHFWDEVSEEGVKAALTQYTQSIALAPNYAPPHAGLSLALMKLTLWGVMSPEEGFRKSKKEAQEALWINPRQASAHSALALILSFGEWDREGALALIQRALALEPSSKISHNALALVQLCQGRFQEAKAALEKSTRLDPISPFSLHYWGLFYYYGRDYERSIENLQGALSIDPRFREAQFFLGHAYLRQGRYQEAIKTLDALPEDVNYGAMKWGALGEAFGVAGDKEEARKALAMLDNFAGTTYVSPVSRLSVHAGLGDWVAVFDGLEQAYEDRSVWLNFAKLDPRYDPIRSDGRFMNLLERIRLA